MLRTPLSERVGVRVPVMQAGMGGIGPITLARLAAAVSNAGALGTLAHPVLFLEFPGDEITDTAAAVARVDRQIRDGIRSAVGLIEGDRPLAINIRVAKEQPDAEHLLHAILDERRRDPRVRSVLRVLVTSAGHPSCFGLNEEIRREGMLHFHTCSSVEHARAIEAQGLDAVVATGYEAAGHLGYKPVHSFVLTPAIAESVSIPVITSGGVADGRSLLGALALGAQMGYMGTRLLASEESEYHENSKQYIVGADETGSTVVPCFYSNARFLANDFTDRVHSLHAEGVSDIDRMKLEGKALLKGAIEGDVKGGFMIGGQVAGRIRSVKPAAQIIADIEREAEEALAGLDSYRAAAAPA